MTETVDLYWQAGKSSKSIVECYADCLKSYFPEADEEEMISWWEPQPDSAADQSDLTTLRESLHPLLRPGSPDFKSGIPAAECRIFFPAGGLHLLAVDNGVRWFAFSRAEVEGWEVSEKLQTDSKTVKLKDSQASFAFNLQEISGSFPGELSICEFTAQGRLVAWILMLEEKGE